MKNHSVEKYKNKIINNNEVKTVMRTSNISPNTKRVGDGASPSKLI